MNTRTRRPRDEIDEDFRTTLDYGVHDHFVLDPRSVEDRRQLAKELEWAIGRYEPRLRLARVTVEPPQEGSRHLIVRLDAQLNTDMIKEPVSFELLSDGKAEVAVLVDAD